MAAAILMEIDPALDAAIPAAPQALHEHFDGPLQPLKVLLRALLREFSSLLRLLHVNEQAHALGRSVRIAAISRSCLLRCSFVVKLYGSKK